MYIEFFFPNLYLIKKYKIIKLIKRKGGTRNIRNLT